MFDAALLHQCAPHVSPGTMLAIIRTESGFNPLALHVNGDFRLTAAPRSATEAAAWANWLIARGYSVDLGLMQINTRWLPVLARHTRHDEVTVRQALRRCCKTRASISPWRERSCGWI